VRRQITRFREPCIQCVDLVFDELERIIHTILAEMKELERFANLKDALQEESTNLLRSCRSPSKDWINNLVNMELNFVNTNHPDFKLDEVIGTVMQKRASQQQAAVAAEQERQQQQQQLIAAQKNPKGNVPQQAHPQQQQQQQQQLSQSQLQQQQNAYNSNQPGFFNMFFQAPPPAKKQDQRKPQSYPQQSGASSKQMPVKLEQVPHTLTVTSIPQDKEFEIELLEALLDKYFSIVRKTIQDMVPKVIMYLMVTKAKQDMQNELIKQLYKESNFETLLAEAPDIQARRQRCKKQLELLTKAQSILNEVRDYSLPAPLQY